MKIHYLALTLLLILFSCPNVFTQECKDSDKHISVGRGGGPRRPDVPRITSKPEPEYTQEARRHGTTCTVVLEGLFHSSGKVQGVCWLSSLPDGLTESAIKAAYKIVFEPATKNGQPISVRMEIQYNFNLY